jgi:hypothetical protein
MPQFVEALELAISKELLTHDQLDQIKEARDKEYRHLNRRLTGYNRRQATDVQMIKKIQEEEKKSNDLLIPKNCIFGGKFV